MNNFVPKTIYKTKRKGRYKMIKSLSMAITGLIMLTGLFATTAKAELLRIGDSSNGIAYAGTISAMQTLRSSAFTDSGDPLEVLLIDFGKCFTNSSQSNYESIVTLAGIATSNNTSIRITCNAGLITVFALVAPQ